MGCADPILRVCDGGTPYVAISKGFGFWDINVVGVLDKNNFLRLPSTNCTVITQIQNLLIRLHMELLHQRHVRWGP